MQFIPEKLRESFENFPKNYMKDFKEFWDWKTQEENNGEDILDFNHLENTHRKLYSVLNKWQTYRNGENFNTEQTLKDSLLRIQQDYSQILKYSLLTFQDIPKECLKRFWDELGRVKEYEGKKNEDSTYYAIAATKPILLLWGQTPAFDTKVRRNLPSGCRVSSQDYKLSFDEWHHAMSFLSFELNKNKEFNEECRRISENLFPESRVVPYGRMLDIYFWV